MTMDLGGREIRRILVRTTNWVGDALLSTPALAALNENFPQAQVTVLAKSWVAPVLAGHPAVDEVFIFDREGRHKGWAGLWRLAQELKQKRFDLAVLFQNAFQSALIAWLARVPLRLGYNTDGRGLLLNRSVHLKPEDKKVHQTEYYLRLLRRAGLQTAKTGPVFYLSAEDEARAAARLDSLGLSGSFLLGLAPGAAYGPAKQWPAERFAAAAEIILRDRKGAVLLFGSRGEARVTGRVAEYLDVPVFDLAGRTGLAEAAALIKQCRLFLTNDSGLMHVAGAVGVPLVAIFGSTNPATTSPIAEHFRIIRHQVECAPCLKQTCDQDAHLCMEAVTPKEVAFAGLELLGEKGEEKNA